MNATSILLGLIIILLGVVIVTQNPQLHTVSVAMFEIRSTVGVACASTFGLGFLIGLIAMLTTDVPRMRRLRSIAPDE